MNSLWLVAGLSLREALRRRGAVVSSLVVGVLLASLLLFVGLVANVVEAGTEDRTYTVAVGGDRQGASALLAELQADQQLVLEDSDDPGEDVVRRRATAGLVLPQDLDRRMAEGSASQLELHHRIADARSIQAFALLGIRIQELERAQLVGPDQGEAPITVVVDPVLRDERVARIQYSGHMAAVATLLCVGVVTGVAGFFGSARQRRYLEPILALPLSRWSLVTGTAAGYWPVGAAGVLAGVAMMLAVAALPATTWAQPPATLVAMGVAAFAGGAVLAVLACAAGAVAGCLGTGSDDAVSVGDLVALPFVAAGVALFLAPDAATGAWAGAIPIYGQALAMRSAIMGAGELVLIAVAVASAALWAAALVAIAVRVVDDERRMLRAVR